MSRWKNIKRNVLCNKTCFHSAAMANSKLDYYDQSETSPAASGRVNNLVPKALGTRLNIAV